MFEEMLDNFEEFQTFAIDTDKKADWALEKIRAEREERDRLVKLVDEHIADLMAKKKDLEDRYKARTSHLEVLLRVYFDTITPQQTKTQATYKLTYGRLVLKQQQPEFLRDDEALLTWAKANTPGMVQVKESVAWGELKKLTTVEGGKVVLSETGEVVGGVEAREREPVFEVQL